MPNCYSFSFEEKIQEMRISGLTEKELTEVDASYKKHTDDLVKNSKNNIDLQYSKLGKLNTRIKKYENSKDQIKLLFDIRSLIDETINYGTLPFAFLARYGFVAMIFLRELKEIGIFSTEEFNDFLSSIPTVASKFSIDQNLIIIEKNWI